MGKSVHALERYRPECLMEREFSFGPPVRARYTSFALLHKEFVARAGPWVRLRGYDDCTPMPFKDGKKDQGSQGRKSQK
jgi:hypothetical protein